MQYLHHYYEYLNLPNRKETGNVSVGNLAGKEFTVTFENVSFKYPGAEKYNLKNINLTMHFGEKIALVGPNGAGKTTLVLLLCRLYEPTEGRILLNELFRTEEHGIQISNERGRTNRRLSDITKRLSGALDWLFVLSL